MSGFKTLRIDEVDALRDADTGADWITLRHRLGVRAFGLNAYRAPEAGVQVIVDHEESESGHQEVYVVLTGEASFAVGMETIDAPAGTVVFVEDPSLSRVAIAKEPGTTVLAVGAQPGSIFTPSTWESELLEGSAS